MGCPESTAYCRALKEQRHKVALLQPRPAVPAADRLHGLAPRPRRDDRARHILQPSDFSGLRAWTFPGLQGSPCLHTHKRAWPGGCCFCGVALNAPSALRYEPMGCSLNVRVGISFPRGLSFLCCKMRLTPRRPGIKWDDTWPG